MEVQEGNQENLDFEAFHRMKYAPGFSGGGKLEMADSLEAEMEGIYRGLTIMFEKGWREIQVETDCQKEVDLLIKGAPGEFPFKAQFERLKIFAPKNWIMWVEQSENFVVNEDPPVQIRQLIVADTLGVVYERE
ncbi:unnamed protein product [Camellia sinensis]